MNKTKGCLIANFATVPKISLISKHKTRLSRLLLTVKLS
uniref:Uncharacterized protein n=1 Tax=Proteus mirabilis TaxID=584 RepID=A0A7L4ZCX9_PROMI|nr:hypothetical protein [Proteus mirabilis]WBR55741.1 hypothetical protein [Proteus mirabilis]